MKLDRRTAAGTIGIAVVSVGTFFGAWWLLFPAGIVIGLVIRRARVALIAGALLGLALWGEELVRQQLSYGLGPTAAALAAIMGFPHQPAIPVVLTCLVGLLLGLTGAWLGSAARQLPE